MTDQHKAALAEGRSQGRAVRNYLEALEATKPKRGRKRTPDSIKKRLEAIDAAMADADKLTELKLRQERVNLARELEAGSVAVVSSLSTNASRNANRHAALAMTVRVGARAVI